MLTLRCLLLLSLSLLPTMQIRGQDHSVEMIKEGPSADGVAKELVASFASQGYRVQRGTRTVCELWLSAKLEVDADFEATPERLYPFTPGQLIGLLHFPRRGADFRDQSISSGWYTLRFDLQPIDGNHVGTSPTRDFLVLVAAEHDEVDTNWTAEELQEVSAEAAGSTHPAMLCLQAPVQDDKPLMRHHEEQDWWILHIPAKGLAAGKEAAVFLDIVVAGHAAE